MWFYVINALKLVNKHLHIKNIFGALQNPGRIDQEKRGMGGVRGNGWTIAIGPPNYKAAEAIE